MGRSGREKTSNPNWLAVQRRSRIAHPSGRGQLFADMSLESMGTPPAGAAYPTFDWMQGMIRWPLWFRNIWLGVSVEDQKTADERIPLLLQTPAAVRWASYEPALGPIDFGRWIGTMRCLGCQYRGFSDGDVCPDCGCSRDYEYGPIEFESGLCEKDKMPLLNWIVAGGESGPKARPSHPDWFRSVRDQCQTAGVPFLFKQWGEWGPMQYHAGVNPISRFPFRCPRL